MVTLKNRTLARPALVRPGWLLISALLLLLPGLGRPVLAADQFPSGPNNRGIITFEPYSVFPENRPGNAVYLNNVQLFSLDNQVIIDVLPLPLEGRFAYLATDSQDKTALGVHLKDSDGPPRITRVADGFYHVVMVLDGVVYKKVYRLIDNKILDLLSASKTADGAIAGPIGVLFYHVATADKEQVDGTERPVFGLQLHLALFSEERLRHLSYLVRNTLPTLDLKWVDENRVSYRLADGRTDELSVSQFQ
jgi:hypothetical protein